MSLVVDETAGDLPVRDVGLMRGRLMPNIPDTVRDVKPWKKPQLMKLKDHQRVFRVPREHLEDQCLRLQDENTVLRQHTRTQEQRLRRMSTRLMRLRQGRQGLEGGKERDMEDTIQQLEAHVATLESQKRAMQSKLSLAKQHIMDLGGHTRHRFSKGRGMDGEGGVRRAAHTAPPLYGPTLEDTREQIERLHSLLSRSSVIETQQVRVSELELAAQALRDTLKEKEKEIEGTMKEMRKQQVEGHRLTIRDNVDVIRLQKQLSDKSTALRVTQEKFNDLQEAYENQLEESQRSLKESQGALLEKVEELSEQLKQERQRSLVLEGQLTTATLSLQALEELEARISDLEGEKALLKESYNTLLESTQSQHHSQAHNRDDKVPDDDAEKEKDEIWRMDVQRLQEMLQAEREERRRLEEEKERLRQEKEISEEQRGQDRDLSVRIRDERERLERQVLQYREQVSTLQTRLDSVTMEFDMSVEELSETLWQIKAFRLQQESKEGLRFLKDDGKLEESSRELADIQASHAETVLELQKTRDLLQLEHRITKDLQEECNTVNQRLEREGEESRRRMAEKDKLLTKRALQIYTLQAQLKELAYSPRNYKRTIPIQYTWPGVDQEVVEPIEDDTSFAQLKAGESLLEIHLKAATFTPDGLRDMGSLRVGVGGGDSIATFCTYALLDFEVHSTPLVSGNQPNYGFTSRYALSARDLGRLGGQGSRVNVELHQAVGGVRFVTHGSGQMSLVGAMERRGERICGRVSITGSRGNTIGVVDFWVRLFPPAEPVDSPVERGTDRMKDRWAATERSPGQHYLGWQDMTQEQELFDFGGGVPNEIIIVMERCVGLSARWPGLLPDAYLTYRFYDLPPHVSPTVQCTADPLFNDAVSYPLAVTADVLQYLRSGSLWVYVFDDSDDQTPSAYLAKTPVPLLALATGREIRGDYVLRDPGGGPRGMARVQIKWRYPFQPPAELLQWKDMDRTVKVMERQGRGVERQDSSLENQRREVKSREEAEESQRPIAKPRVKEPMDEEEELEKKRSESAAAEDSEAPESVESSSHSVDSDIIIVPPKHKTRKGDKLRVEILSLTFGPSTNVALDKSVQRVYVEYRLLGVPMESTETPMSLRKPTEGEEIHYNFTRVIYVDGSESAPLRQYLYTMLEGTDPSRGRLRFTVVSEPMDDYEECIDVGHAFLDLQELLLTGNDVTERQIDIVSVDDEQEVIGKLKVSLEAAKALSGIYWEFHRKKDTEKDETEEEGEEEEEEKREDQIQVIDYDEDSDFY
ncbi:protein fantom [Lampris incognitus]|uniref:protein fantom n=1 Tax=Lampris incognitus TaxID=2546036 RepID=UPI0024B4EA3E|nr:protein fantom [Lampris incognitus]